MAQSLLWDHALRWWGTFKKKNSKVIPTITWAGFKAKLNARFMFHNQVLRDGLELLVLRQGERPCSLTKHVETFSALICLVSMKEEYTQRVAFLNNGLQPWACKKIFQRHEVSKTCQELLKVAKCMEDDSTHLKNNLMSTRNFKGRNSQSKGGFHKEKKKKMGKASP